MRRRGMLVLLASAMLAAALLCQAPAWLIDVALARTPLRCGDCAGTLWHGRGWLSIRLTQADASVRVLPLLPVSWSLGWLNGPAWLIATPEGAGSVQPGWNGLNVHIPAARLSLKRLALPAWVDPGALAGEASLAPATLTCRYAGVCEGSLSFQVRGIAARIFAGEHLADVSGQLTLEPSGSIDGQAVLEGQGAVTGELRFRAQGQARPTIQGWLAPTTDASPGLAATLRRLGPAGPRGVNIELH